MSAQTQKSNGQEQQKQLQAPQTAVVVAVPADTFNELIEILRELPWRQVSSLMNRLAQLKPQEVAIT